MERRPFTARSVIASTLLGVDPPRLPALALVRSGELFGLRAGTTRTALSRMAAAGEIIGDDGHYELAGRLLERHARQGRARTTTPTGPWDGTWTLAVVGTGRRSATERAAFRAAAHALRLAELREGLWGRPGAVHAGDHPDGDPGAHELVDRHVTWVHDARPDDPATFVAAFGLKAWADEARALLTEMADHQDALDARDTTAVPATFVIDAAVVRHLVADPRLPEILLPPDWPAADLRAHFERFDLAFKATWRAWYRAFRSADR